MSPLRRRVAAFTAVWVVGALVLRVTFFAPEVCPPIDADAARRSAVAAGDWIVRTQNADGTYLYEYDRASGIRSDAYNVVRHAGTTMALYQLVAAGEDRFLDPADAATAWMLDQTVPTGTDAVAWAPEATDPKLGAAALLSVSLLIRRIATGEATYDGVLRRLGRFMAGQQLPSGAMLETWRLGAGAPDPAVTSRYATGEALWAFALLHEAFPDEGWDDVAWRTLDYLATARDVDEGIFPRPWPDQWAAYSLAEMAEWGLDDDHVAYARDLAAAFGVQVRWDAQRSGIATFSHPPAPRGAGFGTVLEGSASLERLAGVDPRLADLQEVLAERLVCGASRQADRQVTGDPATGAAVTDGDADLQVGAWFRGDVTRVDDQQHAASGLLFAEALLRGDG